MDDSEYKYTEKDVEKTLGFLRTNLPDHATPEVAIRVLIYCHDKYKDLEDIAPEELEKILRGLEER